MYQYTFQIVFLRLQWDNVKFRDAVSTFQNKNYNKNYIFEIAIIYQFYFLIIVRELMEDL